MKYGQPLLILIANHLNFSTFLVKLITVNFHLLVVHNTSMLFTNSHRIPSFDEVQVKLI